MKVNIDENGMMTVQAETELEAYALKQWSSEALNRDANLSTLTIMANVPGKVREVVYVKR